MADEELKNPALSDALKEAGYQSEGGEIGRRKPGRPPKTSAAVDNANTNYQPSPERNNVDQALQPTGDGDVAGATDGSVKANDKALSGKLFPVRLKRNYRPLEDDNWLTINQDGSYGSRPVFADGETPKVKAGYAIALPVEEAKAIIAKGIAERADEIK